MNKMLLKGPSESTNILAATQTANVAGGRKVYSFFKPDQRSSAVDNVPLRFQHTPKDLRVEPGSNVFGLYRSSSAFIAEEEATSIPQTLLSDLRWNGTRAVLASWAALKDDWDGDDAVAPTDAQLTAVLRFINGAERRGLREPRPYIAPDGEVGFHWDGVHKASVSFLPGDRFLAFCPRGGGEPVRIGGPLDIAACSPTMFDAIAALS